MQCHVEMTEEMIKVWYEVGAREIANSLGPAVQSADAVRKDLANRVFALNVIARRLYTKWISGLSGLG
jgi:cytolysin (calcineurin-like family phosphatase)